MYLPNIDCKLAESYTDKASFPTVQHDSVTNVLLRCMLCVSTLNSIHCNTSSIDSRMVMLQQLCNISQILILNFLAINQLLEGFTTAVDHIEARAAAWSVAGLNEIQNVCDSTE